MTGHVLAWSLASETNPTWLPTLIYNLSHFWGVKPLSWSANVKRVVVNGCFKFLGWETQRYYHPRCSFYFPFRRRPRAMLSEALVFADGGEHQEKSLSGYQGIVHVSQQEPFTKPSKSKETVIVLNRETMNHRVPRRRSRLFTNRTTDFKAWG